MNRMRERAKKAAAWIHDRFPSAWESEVERLSSLVRMGNRQIDRLRNDLDVVDAAWKEERELSKRRATRIEELQAERERNRETFQQLTKANEHLSDLISSQREQIRDLQAQVASCRTIKGVWDASESMLDLTRMLQDRIEKFKRDVGKAYAMDVAAKN